ncbi:hypothetical protein [Paraburkholderia sp.]|uniref:hypothetical protein n=1 Tax=Paraburkholderia sp. TaxID=1926495 RepID=UPI002F3F437F
MNKIRVKAHELGSEYCLSPEIWLSQSRAESLTGGTPLTDLVEVTRLGVTQIGAGNLVLDTGHAERGLLSLRGAGTGDEKQRVSHKKYVPEGAVIISRLRPYLRQVAYIPHGVKALIGVQDIYCSTEFYVLTPRSDSESIAFIVPWLLSDPVQEIFEQATTGGHHPRFDEGLLMRLAVSQSFVADRRSLNKKVTEAVSAHLQAQIDLASVIRRYSE